MVFKGLLKFTVLLQVSFVLVILRNVMNYSNTFSYVQFIVWNFCNILLFSGFLLLKQRCVQEYSGYCLKIVVCFFSYVVINVPYGKDVIKCCIYYVGQDAWTILSAKVIQEMRIYTDFCLDILKRICRFGDLRLQH